MKKWNWAKRLVTLITSGMAMSKAGWRTLSLIRFGWWTSFTLGKPRDLKLNWSSSSILGEDKELEGLQEVEVEDKEELMELLHSRRTSDPLVVIFTHTFQLSLDYLLKTIFTWEITSVSKYVQLTQSKNSFVQAGICTLTPTYILCAHFYCLMMYRVHRDRERKVKGETEKTERKESGYKRRGGGKRYKRSRIALCVVEKLEKQKQR